MTRTRRTRDIDAGDKGQENESSGNNQNDQNNDERGSSRPLRRACFRSGRHGARSLTRRRADFERMVTHHISSLREHPSAPHMPWSSLTESSQESEPQQPNNDLLTPSNAHDALQDDDGGFQKFRVMLRQLRLIPNKSEQEQDTQSENNVHGLAEVLSTDKFLAHDDDRIRLLNACCLAEILRISAPDPPISQHKLTDICTTFIEQITVMASPKDQMHLYRFALLEQLATVKSFVLFCDDHDIVADIFAAFYATARPHQTNKVREHMCDILVSLIDETETIQKSMMDALLAPLVPGLRYNESAVRLSEFVLTSCQHIVQVALCNMLNASLRQMYQHHASQSSTNRSNASRLRSPRSNVRSDRSDESQDLSEHHQYISDLLVSINRVVPDVLVYVLPNLNSHITSEDDNVRNAGAKLLARLFTSRKDIVDSYPTLFHDYLHLQGDKIPDTRATVTESLGELIIADSRKTNLLDDILKDRILDKDEHVRTVAAKSMGIAGLNCSDDSLKCLATRIRDKKHVVRKEALNQLTKLYRTATNIGDDTKPTTQSLDANDGALTNLDINPDDDSNTPRSTPSKRARRNSTKAALAYDRLSWFPRSLMDSYAALRGNDDGETTLTIEEIIAFDIPEVKISDEKPKMSSVTKITSFLSLLSDSGFRTFCLLVRDRQKTWQVLRSLCQYRLKPKPNTSNLVLNDQTPTKSPTFSKRATGDKKSRRSIDQFTTPQLRNLVRSLAFHIQRRGCALGDVESLCYSFAKTVDLKVFSNILKLLDDHLTPTVFQETSQDIIGRLGSNTSVGKFTKRYLLSICRPDVFSPACFSFASDMVIKLTTPSTEVILQNTDMSDVPQQSDNRTVRVGMLRFLYACSYSDRILREKSEDVFTLFTNDFAIGSLDAEFALCGLRLVSRSPKEDAMKLWNKLCYDTVQRLITTEKLENVSQETLLAKWGCRALINSSDVDIASESSMLNLTDVTKQLTKRLDGVTTSVESVILPLIALGQLAKHAPDQFKPNALECFDFCQALLNGSYNHKIKQNHPELVQKQEGTLVNEEKDLVTTWAVNISNVLGEDKSSLADMVTNHNHRCILALIRGAIKLMVYSLSCLESCHDEFVNIVELLLRVSNEKDGDVFEITFPRSRGSNDTSEEKSNNLGEAFENVKALCRLAASHGILYIGRHPKFARHIPNYVFPLAALRAQDSNAVVRLMFARCITFSILRKRLPLRWASSLLIMGVDPLPGNLGQVKDWLTSIFRYRRRMYEAARRSGQGSSTQLLPESIVPDFIWILAHMLDIEIDQEAGFPESQQCVELLLDRLLESSEHARVIGEFLESISLARDSQEAKLENVGPYTKRMWELGRMAGIVLKHKQSGKKWNVSDRSGKVSLPKDMFFMGNRKEETSGVKPVSLLEVARRLDREGKLGSARKHTDSRGTNVETPIKTISGMGEGIKMKSDTPSVVKDSGMDDTLKDKDNTQNDNQSSSSGSNRKRRSQIVENQEDEKIIQKAVKKNNNRGKQITESSHTTPNREENENNEDEEVEESPKKKIRRDIENKNDDNESGIGQGAGTHSTQENLSDKENTEATKSPLLEAKEGPEAEEIERNKIKERKSSSMKTIQDHPRTEKTVSEGSNVHTSSGTINPSPRRVLRSRDKTQVTKSHEQEIEKSNKTEEKEDCDTKSKLKRSPRRKDKNNLKGIEKRDKKQSAQTKTTIVVRRSARHKRV